MAEEVEREDADMALEQHLSELGCNRAPSNVLANEFFGLDGSRRVAAAVKEDGGASAMEDEPGSPLQRVRTIKRASRTRRMSAWEKTPSPKVRVILTYQRAPTHRLSGSSPATYRWRPPRPRSARSRMAGQPRDSRPPASRGHLWAQARAQARGLVHGSVRAHALAVRSGPALPELEQARPRVADEPRDSCFAVSGGAFCQPGGRVQNLGPGLSPSPRRLSRG